MTAPLVLYHDRCWDGLVAAWAAKRILETKHESVECRAVRYGEPAPTDVAGRDIYIVDFSYPKEAVLAMAASAREVLLLDHHKSAFQELAGQVNPSPQAKYTNTGEDFPKNVHILLDMEKSGARLAWEWFNADKVPAFVEYVEDRDLWRWGMPESQEVNAYIRLHERTFENCDRLHRQLQARTVDIPAQGRLILDAQQAVVREACEHARMVKFDELDIPTVSSSTLQSEICHELLERFPDAPFACAIDETPDKRVFSLRSRSGGDVDVSEVARALGGGGHKHSAGFEQPQVQLAFGTKRPE